MVDVLRLTLEEMGVEIRTSFLEVTALKRGKKGGFQALSKEETLHADAVIICCGGMAGGKLGGTQSGYDLLKSQGHTITKLFPALVQVKTDTTFVKALKGVLQMALVLVERNGKILAEKCRRNPVYGLSASVPDCF